MKIAIDCHTLEIKDWAGKEQYLFNLIKEFSIIDKKNDYILYFRNRVDIQKNIDLPENWNIKYVKLPTPFWQFFILFRIVFLDKIDFLLVPSTYLLPAINIFTSMGVIIHDLTTFLPKIKKTHKKLTVWREKLVLGRALKNSSKIFTVSDNTKSDLIAKFDLEKEKITTIYAAPQILDMTCLSKDIFVKHKIPDDYILFVGTLEPRKNIIGLIKSFSLIKNEIPTFKLLIVGKRGWYYDAIFELVEKLKLEDRIIFTGYVDNEDLSCLYRNATCFIYISFYEGFGMPPVEAMSFGLPVIVSNNSSLAEIIGDGGVLVNPNNEKEVSKAIKTVLHDKEYSKQLSQRAIERASMFSWENTAKKILFSIDDN